MLTRNLEVERGLVNGARGVVLGFEPGKQGQYVFVFIYRIICARLSAPCTAYNRMEMTWYRCEFRIALCVRCGTLGRVLGSIPIVHGTLLLHVDMVWLTVTCLNYIWGQIIT